MIRLTPISVVNERTSGVILPSNPFDSSTLEIIRYLSGPAGVDESTVVKVMGAQYYVEPEGRDEFIYYGFEFDSEEHAPAGAAKLESRYANHPESVAVFSGGPFLVFFFRDSRREATDDCFYSVKDMIAQIVE